MIVKVGSSSFVLVISSGLSGCNGGISLWWVKGSTGVFSACGIIISKGSLSASSGASSSSSSSVCTSEVTSLTTGFSSSSGIACLTLSAMPLPKSITFSGVSCHLNTAYSSAPKISSSTVPILPK